MVKLARALFPPVTSILEPKLHVRSLAPEVILQRKKFFPRALGAAELRFELSVPLLRLPETQRGVVVL
jgi:hypothetical protein